MQISSKHGSNRNLLLFLIILMAICAIYLPFNLRNQPDKSNVQLCKDCNIIVITVDALRPDYLGVYSKTPNVSNNIDNLAEKSYIFENCFAPASHTVLSVTGILTSTNGYGYSTKISLPGTLKKYNFRTSFFSANGYLSKRNFGAGFDDFYELWEKKDNYTADINDYSYDSKKLNADLFEWLDNHKTEKFFAYIQYIDVHSPWILNETKGIDDPERYKIAVNYLDAQIGALMEKLDSLGLMNNTIIIITADHGEELYDHGRRGHAATLYDEVIHVPLILYVPNTFQKKPIQIDNLVSSLDIMPTLLQLEGIPMDKTVEGISLLNLPSRKEDDRIVYSITDHEHIMVSLRTKEFHYILTLNYSRADWAFLDTNFSHMSPSILTEELFYLPEDPKEKNNIIEKDASPSVRFRNLAINWFKSLLSKQNEYYIKTNLYSVNYS